MSPPNLCKDLKNVAVLGAVNPKRLRIDIWSKQGYLDGNDIQACAGAMKRKLESVGLTLVMDDVSIHRSTDVTEFFEKQKIEILWLPTCSQEFNSAIEEISLNLLRRVSEKKMFHHF